jgi:ABC-type cobalamin transport system ATPase subunit
MENKIDWSKIDKQKFAELFVLEFMEYEHRRLAKFRAYWNYHLFTPFYLKIWHKLTFKKTPKI